MKVALLSFEYPPETGFGGIGTYTWYQARALVKMGHDVHVLAGAVKPSSFRPQGHDGVKVFRYHKIGRWLKWLKVLEKKELWWTKGRIKNALNMFGGFKILNRMEKFDLLEMPDCGAEGLLVNYFTRIPTLVRFHSPARLIMPFYPARPTDMRLCSTLEKLAIRGARAYTSCSQFLTDAVRDRLGIKRAIRVIPNGIDLSLFDADETYDFREKFDLPRDRTMILFSGRMERRKGIHLCKEIAASILERYGVIFVFAGQDAFGYMENTLLPYLKSKNLKGSAHYLGRLQMTDIRSALCQTDIFLLPSLWENCPYACLEAMAAGRAIVSSDQGGMPELIRDGENGLLAKSEDPLSYTHCLERLIEDQNLRERLGQEARWTIETSFTDIHVAKKSLHYYNECIGS